MAEQPNLSKTEKKPIGGEMVIPIAALCFTVYYFITIIDTFSSNDPQEVCMITGILEISECFIIFFMISRPFILGNILSSILGSPEVDGGNGTVGPPGFSALYHLRFVIDPEEDLHAAPDAKIVQRKKVRPPHGEHEEHLGGPAADADDPR